MRRHIEALLYWLMIACVVVVMGMVYDLIFLDGEELLVASIFALFCAMPILFFRRGFPSPRLLAWLRSRPTLVYHALSFATTFLLVNIGYTLGSSVMHAAGLIPGDWRMLHTLPADVFLYSLAGSGLVLFVLHVRELLGRKIFLSLLTGRYRNPVEEERIFLFIDLVDSVSYAETWGDVRALKFLSELFAVIDPHVQRHGGAVDDYIGDAAMITWPIRAGVKDAACVMCVFDILADIERNSGRWKRQHGRVPQVRAVLHAGPVVTGEVGLDHRKITYFGNAVNTAARLEQLAKTLGHQVLLSGDLKNRLQLPPNVEITDLGEHAVRGRKQNLQIFGVGRSAVPNPDVLTTTS